MASPGQKSIELALKISAFFNDWLRRSNNYKAPIFYCIYHEMRTPTALEYADDTRIYFADDNLEVPIQDVHRLTTKTISSSELLDAAKELCERILESEEPIFETELSLNINGNLAHIMPYTTICVPYGDLTKNFFTKDAAKEYIKNELSHKNETFYVVEGTFYNDPFVKELNIEGTTRSR